jgi:diacylglycerol kinase family enzyme
VLQVLNGLLSRSDRAEAVTIPVGIIPAGSDNSLAWTVLGVRDPISASLLIVRVNPCSTLSRSFYHHHDTHFHFTLNKIITS